AGAAQLLPHSQRLLGAARVRATTAGNRWQLAAVDRHGARVARRHRAVADRAPGSGGKVPRRSPVRGHAGGGRRRGDVARRGEVMSHETAAARQAPTVSLADEEAVKQILVSTVFGLWDVVNNLTRLRPSKRERYRVTIFGSARARPGTYVF